MDFWEEIYSNLREAIFSMSEHLRDIGYRLRGRRDIIVEHLIKLYYFRDSQRAGVWKRSVYSAVSKVSSWKGRKYPAWDFIYGCIWKAIKDDWGDQFSGWVEGVAEYLDDGSLDIGVMLQNPRPVDVGNLIENYCYWLSHALESKGRVSPAEVYEVIDDLLGRDVVVPTEKS
jgi:hypothetical protein